MNAYGLASVLYDMGVHDEDGTVSAYDLPLPTHGYWVGGNFASLVFDSVESVDRGEIAWWIGNNKAPWYGVWVDQETGKIYFDGVNHVFDGDTAEYLGRSRNEIAIWDIANGLEVRL